jgi:DedD protein
MIGSLTPREAFWLYGMLLVLLLAFFGLGLFLGRQAATDRDVQESVAFPETQAEPVQAELTFLESSSRSSRSSDDSKEIEKGANKPSKPVEPAVVLTTGDYTIQVAAYLSRKEAEELQDQLKVAGFKARVVEPNLSAGDRYFRVWVGSFTSMDQARSLEQDLKDAGLNTYVRKAW